MSLRSELVELLRGGPLQASVLEYSSTPSDLRNLTFMVEVTGYAPGASQGLLSVTARVFLLSPYESYDRAEDQLESAVFDLFDVLNNQAFGSIGTAERVVVAERFHGLRVDISTQITKE